MSVIVDEDIDRLLKATSRSFYLSLQALPDRIRDQVGLLYLLARVADTIADTGENPSLLLTSLNEYQEACVQGLDDIDLTKLASLQSDPDESDLLIDVTKVIGAFQGIESNDRDIMLGCLLTIISGQRLDIERFGTKESAIVSLRNDAELDDYTYRVAGSVGEFWTKISINHHILNPADSEILLNLGIQFGKALQLINILRDIPSDLSIGRCYIPSERLAEFDMVVTDLLEEGSMEKFRPLYTEYLDLACRYLDSARTYTSMIPKKHRGLRISCMLPIIIGWRTIGLMRRGDVLDKGKPIKISRRTIGWILVKTRLASIIGGYESMLMRSERTFAR